MRYSPYTYQGMIGRASQIITKLYLVDRVPEVSMVAWERYLKHTDPIQGVPQKNMEWSIVNNRAGYQSDVPGLLSEILAQCCSAIYYGKDCISIAEDKHTQHELKIDYFVTDLLKNTYSVQVKTIRFDGLRTSLVSQHYEGQANTLALVDIDDQVCYFIDRERIKALHQEKRGYFFKWDLEELAHHWVNMKDWY